ALDEVLGELAARAREGPRAADLREAGEHGDRRPHEERGESESAFGCVREREGREGEVDRRADEEESAGERQRLEGLRLEDASEERARSLAADVLGVEARRAAQEAAFQERAEDEREIRLQPALEPAQRQPAREAQDPGRDPRRVEATLESAAAERDPGREARGAREEARGDDRDELPPEALAPSLLEERPSGREADEPRAADRDAAEVPEEQRRPRPRPARGADLGRVEDRLEVPRDVGL